MGRRPLQTSPSRVRRSTPHTSTPPTLNRLVRLHAAFTCDVVARQGLFLVVRSSNARPGASELKQSILLGACPMPAGRSRSELQQLGQMPGLARV